MPSVWRSRPIFITSTFRDMHAERDWLRTRVFPEIEERLRARFHHLETIDLRWGVDSASAEQEHDREIVVLSVCLDEITRSRPFLIGLLGDRYGWRPPAARINGAAREAGLNEDVAGRSVTELEILHGVLRSPGQQHRSWFYLRDPLPYDAMPPEIAARYSDRHAGEPDADEKVRKLSSLKARLVEALPDRVRRYHAGWDAARLSISEADLQAWGAQVLEDLWSDLEAETAAFLREAPQTWQEQDRWAQDEFVEGRVRGFVGRTNITNTLLELATSPAAYAATWGACVTAEAGGGKSSLFGHLYRTLQQQGVLVLAHAAGISVRSTQVDWMLRRWAGELAAHLGQADPLGERATPDEIDQTFGRLLHQTAESRRVVVLLDAINQFEPTPRGTHLTWIPRLWPTNARLIATAIPGTQSNALLGRPGAREAPLGPVEREEAGAIIDGICDRYHRVLNPRVADALLGKSRDNGQPSFGNPLWLEIATEELNLLDARAFDRAEADRPSGAVGATRIVNLLVETVAEMPGEIEGLYGFMLDRAERQFGRAWTRAFVHAIGVSRAGWRESDLEALIPVLSGERWDPLRFATLRRGFRAHVVQRGAHAQWDFSHAQMRQAVAQRLTREQAEVAALHQQISQHLLGLRRDDPLHETETMVHLMQTGDLRQAAAFYGNDLTPGEARGATAALQSLVLGGEAQAVASLLDQRLEVLVRHRVAERFLFDLNDGLENMATLDVRLRLLQAAQRTLEEDAASDRGNAGWQRDLAFSHDRLGDVLRAQGNLTSALAAFRASLITRERLATDAPDNAGWQHNLSISHSNLGDVLVAQGDLAGALTAFQASLAILERLAAAGSTQAGRQRDLSVSHGKVGDVLKAQGNLAGALAAFQAGLDIAERLAAADPGHLSWQRDLAVSHSHLGDALAAQGNLAGALAAFRASLDIAERLAAADPGNVGWQRDLAICHERMGDMLTAQENLAGAPAAFRASLAIAERLAAADPGHVGRQHDLSIAHIKLGDVLTKQENLAGALAAFQRSLAIFERLAAADPDHAGWQRDLAACHSKLGNALRDQGNLAGALAAFEASHDGAQRLAAADPNNTGWQRDLAVSHEKLGDVLTAQGNLTGARAAFQASLAIAERLAAADPGNAVWQRHLVVSNFKLANLLQESQDPSAAHHWHRCHDVLGRMRASGMFLDPPLVQLLDWLDRTAAGEERMP